MSALTRLVVASSLIIAGLLPVSRPAVAQQSSGSALSWLIPELPPLAPIRAEEFAARRRALSDSIGEGTLVIFGARAPAQDYLPYQQNPAFRYLTGIEEPDAVLIMYRSAAQVIARLVVQERNPAHEVRVGMAD